MVKRVSWLSVTPEPERELPEAVATLRCGRRPSPEAVASERDRIERLVLRASEREWLRYLHGVVQLIERSDRGGGGDALARARTRATAVIANHHNLLLALPGRGAQRTAADRARLVELVADDPIRPSPPKGSR
jgi:hypothetical protein